MRLEHHLVGGYVRYISPHIIIIIIKYMHLFVSSCRLGPSSLKANKQTNWEVWELFLLLSHERLFIVISADAYPVLADNIPCIIDRSHTQ